MEKQRQADLAIINGKVITVDKDFSIKQAVAAREGKIAVVGTNEEVRTFVGQDTKVLDIKGKVVLPGINDSHCHAALFGGTRPPLALDLGYPTVKSIRDIAEVLRKEVEKVQLGEWIRGFGWDQGYLEECKRHPTRFPRKRDIDPVSPNNPVAFTDYSGHTLLVNSKALELAGVAKDTPDPEGGEIEKDPTTGEPTGIFKELSAQALVNKVVPFLTKEQKREAILYAMKQFNANGITSYTEGALGPGGDTFAGGLLGAECIDIYKELYDQGSLTARVTILLLMGEYGALRIEDLKKGLDAFTIPPDLDNEWLRIPGVKIFADGIPETKTAWMSDEYIGGGYGSLVTPGETDADKYDELVSMIVYAHEHGFQVGVHACGDRTIDATVDGFVKAMQQKPRLDPRHYVIHGENIRPECARRVADQNLSVATQPEIKTIVADFDDKTLGPGRSAYEWPTRTLLDAAVNPSAGSDTPVTYPNWRQGVQSAVLREAKGSGKVSGPEQCIGIEDAIRMYTINGAWQDYMEDVKGSIEMGKLADFCILGEDILTIDPHRIGDIPVLVTIVGGKIVYDAFGDAFK